MGIKGGLHEVRHRYKGPDLPNRTQNRESFQRNVPFPPSPEQEFARQHADIYGKEENMVDGLHVGNPHFPSRSERARTQWVYTTSTKLRDRTRDAYASEFSAAYAESESFNEDQREYYDRTSDGLLPRHHAALLPLARAREEPNYHNAVNRERIVAKQYAYHDLEDQRGHWRRTDEAYQEHEQARADHARHRTYRSYGGDYGLVDCYKNSPVHHTTPHTRSRQHGLPPPGTYCDKLSTPPEGRDPWTDEDYRE